MAEGKTIPDQLKYTEDHEWVEVEDDVATVGVTDYAQNELGDVVYVELPELDVALEAGDEAGVVESVKAASDVYAPIGGTVIAVNAALEDAPETVNEDPYGAGWFYRIDPNDVADLDELLDAEAYNDVCASEEH